MTDCSQCCDRFGCQAPALRSCLTCGRGFCVKHEQLPYGHVCLGTLPITFNAQRQLDSDEEPAALERFRPLP